MSLGSRFSRRALAGRRLGTTSARTVRLSARCTDERWRSQPVPCGQRESRCLAGGGIQFRIRSQRRLVSDAVQRRLVSVAQLEAAVGDVPRRGSRWLRESLEDVGVGTRSMGESRFRRAVRRAGLPEPEWNVPIETAYGKVVLDALWREASVAVEIDGAGGIWTPPPGRQISVGRTRSRPVGCWSCGSLVID